MSINGVNWGQVSELLELIPSNNQRVLSAEEKPQPSFPIASASGRKERVDLVNVFKAMQGTSAVQSPAASQVIQVSLEMSRIFKTALKAFQGVSSGGKLSALGSLVSVVPILLNSAGQLPSNVTLPVLLGGGVLFGLYAWTLGFQQPQNEATQEDRASMEGRGSEKELIAMSRGPGAVDKEVIPTITSLSGRVAPISHRPASSKMKYADMPKKLQKQIAAFSAAYQRSSFSFSGEQQEKVIEALVPVYEAALTGGLDWGGVLFLQDFGMSQEELSKVLASRIAREKQSFRAAVQAEIDFQMSQRKGQATSAGKMLRIILSAFESTVKEASFNVFSQGEGVTLDRGLVKRRLNIYWMEKLIERYQASLQTVQQASPEGLLSF